MKKKVEKGDKMEKFNNDAFRFSELPSSLRAKMKDNWTFTITAIISRFLGWYQSERMHNTYTHIIYLFFLNLFHIHRKRRSAVKNKLNSLFFSCSSITLLSLSFLPSKLLPNVNDTEPRAHPLAKLSSFCTDVRKL